MEMKKQSSVNGGGGGGRRKSKGSESTQKKNKQPMRGMGVAMLERQRLEDEWKTKMTKMTEMPSLHPLPIPVPIQIPSMAFPTPSSSCITVANGGGGCVQFRPSAVAASNATPGMFFNGVFNGSSSLLISSDQGVNGGFRFENSKELSSIPNYVKCASDGCGICHKKKRIDGGSNACSVNPFRKFYVNNNTAGEMIDAGKFHHFSRNQVLPEVMAVRRSSLPEFEFFPGKKGDGGEHVELMMMRMGSTATTTTWCGTGSNATCSSVGGGYGGGGGMIGLRGGEGSCVTAITGGEEGSVSSVDLSLKLSY